MFQKQTKKGKNALKVKDVCLWLQHTTMPNLSFWKTINTVKIQFERSCPLVYFHRTSSSSILGEQYRIVHSERLLHIPRAQQLSK